MSEVLLFEDDADLVALLSELLVDAGYVVCHVTDVEALISEAEARRPCVALVDGTSPVGFDLWWLGPRLSALGVPPIAFTAHASAVAQWEAAPNDYAGIVAKPFDADEFLLLLERFCGDPQSVASV